MTTELSGHFTSIIKFPLSVTTGPIFFTPSRRTTSMPWASRICVILKRASGIISIGRAKPFPIDLTFFLSSAMTTNSFELYAIIFSLRRAAPPPLIRFLSGSISSAPSIARSKLPPIC